MGRQVQNYDCIGFCKSLLIISLPSRFSEPTSLSVSRRYPLTRNRRLKWEGLSVKSNIIILVQFDSISTN